MLGASRLDQVGTWVRREGVRFEHPPRDTKMGSVAFVPDCGDKLRHLALSASAPHPLERLPDIESSALFAIQCLCRLGPDAARWRRQVLNEIRELAVEMRPELEAWRQSLPRRIRKVYVAPKSPTGMVAVPLLGRLLEILGVPGWQQLVSDLSQGFRVLGELEKGTGWAPLDKPRPAEAMPLH